MSPPIPKAGGMNEEEGMKVSVVSRDAALLGAAPELSTLLEDAPNISIYLVEEDQHVWLSVGGFHIGKVKKDSHAATALLRLEAHLRETER